MNTKILTGEMKMTTQPKSHEFISGAISHFYAGNVGLDPATRNLWGNHSDFVRGWNANISPHTVETWINLRNK